MPVYTTANMTEGSWGSYNMLGEMLTITYENGVTVDFRKEAPYLIRGPHNPTSFNMHPKTYDKLCEQIRKGFTLVSNDK